MAAFVVRMILPCLLAVLFLPSFSTCKKILVEQEYSKSQRNLNHGNRVKRNVANFGMMVMCATGRNPLDYVGYGCWCGKGGRGPIVDAVDQCCYNHDMCWSRARKEGCGYGHWSKYGKWQCVNGTMPGGCEENMDPCDRLFCECDVSASLCFQRTKFNEQMKAWQGACRSPIASIPGLRKMPTWFHQAIRSLMPNLRIPKPRIPWRTIFGGK